MACREDPKKNRARVKAWRLANPDKRSEQATLYRSRHPTQKREDHLRRRYGLSIAAVERLTLEQGGKCAICRLPFRGRPFVDHNHTTEQVRALLCPGCNGALGYLERDGWLAKALAYLNRHDQTTM